MTIFNGKDYGDIPTFLSGSNYLLREANGNGQVLDRFTGLLVDTVSDSAKQMQTTSSSSVSIGTGSKVFILNGAIPVIAGTYYYAIDTANSSNYLYGIVDSYDAPTRTMTLTVTDENGSGTISSWNIVAGGLKGQNGTPSPFITTTGTSTAYVADFIPAIGALQQGYLMVVKLHTDCGSSPTININSLGAVLLKKPDGNSLNTNDLRAGQEIIIAYDGTYIQVISGASGSAYGLAPVVSAAGTAQTLNYANGNVFDLTGTASTACTLSFSNLPASGTFAFGKIIWRQPAITGGATLIYPAGAKWIGQSAPQNTAPNLTTSAGYVHEIEFFTEDAGATIYFNLVGGEIANSPQQVAGIYLLAGTGGRISSSSNGKDFSLLATQFSGVNILFVKNINSRLHFGCSTAGSLSNSIKYTINGINLVAWGTSVTRIPNDLFADSVGTIYLEEPTSVTGGTFITSSDGGASTSTVSAGTFNPSAGWIWASSTAGQFLAISKANPASATVGPAFSAITHTGIGSGTLKFLSYLNGFFILGYSSGDIGYKATATATALTNVSSVVGANQVNKIIWTGTKWVAAANGGKIANASTIGSWTSRTTGVSGNIVDIAYNTGITMAVTDLGEIIRSTDNGDTWVILQTTGTYPANPFAGFALKFIKFLKSQWWTGGALGKLGSSSDGLIFAQVNSQFGGETINDMDAL